jgi:hypothetical protein
MCSGCLTECPFFLDHNTVVVGRKSYHGLKALLTSHISDALISQGEDLAVWVVE